MTRKYSTTHCLDLDEDGVASALVTVRLQGVSLLRATMFVDAVLATAGEYVLEEDRPTIQPPPICETGIRPQTSGPCVHLDQIATDDPEEVQALGVACRHPAGECPHMDNPEITCPIHDACEAMYCVMRARDECEAEQEEQDAAMAADPEVLAVPLSSEATPVPQSDYVLAAPQDPRGPVADPGPLRTYVVEPGPEFPDPEPEEKASYEPTRRQKIPWTADEIASVAAADSHSQAVADFRAQFPDSARTDGAIKAQWRKLRGPDRETSPVTATPAPDFIGDRTLVTQCDEAAIRRPRFKAGDKVRISHPTYKGYTGTIRRYYAATANYLTHIDGTTDTMWLSEEYLEAA